MIPNPKRVLGGAKAKQEGASFEHMVEKHCRIAGVNFVNIPMGAKMVRGMGGMKMIPVRTAFDYVLAKNGIATFIDAKSTSDGTFKFKLIKEHQLNSLLGLERAGFTAGYLVFFRLQNKVVFFSAKILSGLRLNSGLKPEDGLHIGGIYDMRIDSLMNSYAALADKKRET